MGASPSSRRALHIRTRTPASLSSAVAAADTDDADDEAEARFSGRRAAKRSPAAAADEDVLTEVVRRDRDWQTLMHSSSSSPIDKHHQQHELLSAHTANGVSLQPIQSTADVVAGLEDLMHEWDAQSEVIEKQQSTGKATGRARFGQK